MNLLAQEKVAVVFGGDGSSGRKFIIPFFEKYDQLLFYPAPYEGLEESRHVISTGSTPNQLVIPATKWCIETLGARKFFLIGTDDLRARAVSTLLQDSIIKFGAEVVGTHYALVGESQFSALAKRIEECEPQVILNLLVGDSCGAFFRALFAAELTSGRLPVVSFAMGENELAELGELSLSGHYVARTRFADADAPAVDTFLSRFQRKYGVHRAVSEVMEAAYYGVYLWAAAVEIAGTEQVDQVRSALSQKEYDLGSVRVGLTPARSIPGRYFSSARSAAITPSRSCIPQRPRCRRSSSPRRARAPSGPYFAQSFKRSGHGSWANPEKPDSARRVASKEPRRNPRRK